MKKLMLGLAMLALTLPSGALAQDDDGDSGGGNRSCVLIRPENAQPYYVCSGG